MFSFGFYEILSDPQRIFNGADFWRELIKHGTINQLKQIIYEEDIHISEYEIRMQSCNTEPKKIHPAKNANILSQLTFWWMIPIFRTGYKRDLSTDDLPEPLDVHTSHRKGEKLEKAWKEEVEKAKISHCDPSLTKVLIKVFGPSIACYGLRFALVEIIKLLQPISLGYLILEYSSMNEIYSKRKIWLYSGMIILSSLLSSFIYYPTLLATFHKSLKLKISCASLIYRKALRLNKATFHNVTTGHIVNLMSADLSSMDLICYFCHNLWIGPLVTILASYLMYSEIGLSALFGVFIILLTIPFQGWLTKYYASLKKRGAGKTDERLELMNQIVKGIQVIKMYAWENFFKKSVSDVRRKEMTLIRHSLFIKGLHLAFTLFRTRTGIFSSILVYVVTGNILTAKKAFVVTACFNTMRHTMTDLFSFAIEQAAVAKVSIKRVEKFLLLDEIVSPLEYKDSVTNGTNEKPKNKTSGIIMENVYASWNDKEVLEDINLRIDSSEFLVICGRVGSGKTSILNVILKELLPSRGVVDVKGTISYASQEPWLFSGSIKQNILFGSTYNEEKYNRIISDCCLKTDIDGFLYRDETIIGDRGASLSGGQRIRINLARALYKEADIYLFDDPFSALDANVANQIFNNLLNSFLKSKICVLVTHQEQYIKYTDRLVLVSEGKILKEGSYKELNRDFEELESVWRHDESIENKEGLKENKAGIPKPSNEQRKTGRVTWETYKEYFQCCKNNFYVVLVFLLFILAQVCASGADYFVKYWVNLEQSRHLNQTVVIEDDSSWQYSRQLCIYSYSGITLATIVVTLSSCFMFYTISTRASQNLHDSVLTTILSATIKFFNTNPAGRIINRFSKDIEIVDVVMPYVMINCIQTTLTIVGVVILVSVVNPWLVLPTVLAFLVLQKLRTLYLTVSNNFKRLESTTRSSMLSYVTATLEGLSTIRAFKAQDRLQSEFDNVQDIHTSARYYIVVASRMFAIWLELVCSAYLSIVIFSFLIFGNEYGGNVGLAITQVMSMLGSIQWGIRQSSDLENHMTAVERVIEYRDLEEVEPHKEKEPIEDWPTDGKIEFQDVKLSYEPNEAPILKDVSFTIKPRQKIGIVGRTGSGKSSIMNALFQLTPTTGTIKIDDVDITKINLQALRSKISIIPQEPILFSGTVRNNLNPSDKFNDYDLCKIIEEVKLNESKNLQKGLDTEVIENGSNFSVGEKQLLCLARAIIRNNKILVLDEATANIDHATDSLIQELVRKKFQECTVLTIAHRLENIANCDSILVVEDGKIMEFDHPLVLFQNENSYLTKMLAEAGEEVASKFKIVAKQNYQKSNE